MRGTALLICCLLGTSALARDAEQHERTFEVGKWPEGVVATPDALWVAESGQRSLARLDRDGRLLGRVPVGRLPTALAVDAKGRVHALAATDNLLFRIGPSGRRPEVLTGLPDYGETIVHADGALFVLLWAQNSSSGSSLLRIDAETGARRRSADLGPEARALAVGAGRAFVVAATGRIASVDARTLTPGPGLELKESPGTAAFAAGALYVGGASTISRIDAGSLAVTHTQAVGGRVAALGAWQDLVVASVAGGDLLVLDPATLAPHLRLRPSLGAYDARALARVGPDLYLTEHGTRQGPPDAGTLVHVALPALP